MAVDAAQVSPHQSVSNVRSVSRTRTFGDERIANEARKLLVPDDNAVVAHARAGK